MVSGHGAREFRERGVLVVVVPGIVRVAEPPQHFHAVAKVLARIQTGKRPARDHQVFGVRIQGACVTNAAKQSLPGVVVRGEHLFEDGTSRQIGVRNDRGDHRPAATAFRTRRRDLGDEFGFADAAHVFGTRSAVARTAFDEHGLLDVVPGIGVGPQFVERIVADVVAAPQVVVRIDDPPRRLDRRLLHLIEPLRIDRFDGRHSLSSLFSWPP